MSAYRLTEHAQKRKQQRGISDLQIELIRSFGDDHYQKGGCVLSFIAEKKLVQLREAIDRLSGMTIVKSPREEVVTVMRMGRRVTRTEYVA